MSVTVKLLPLEELKKILGIENKGPVHAYFTSECAREMDPFVPFDEGILAGTVIENEEPTSNVDVDSITYDQEYASYQYYGMREDGSHVIVNRSLDKHPLATSYWDQAMWTAKGDDITKRVQKRLDRGGE